MLRSYRGRPAQRPGFLPAPPAEARVLQGRAVDLAVLRRIGRRGPQHAPSVRKRWFGGGGGGARRSRGGGRRTRKPGQALRGRADRHRPGCSHALIGRRNPWQAVRRPATTSTSPRLSAVPLRSKHLRRRSEGRQPAHWLTGQGRRGGGPAGRKASQLETGMRGRPKRACAGPDYHIHAGAPAPVSSACTAHPGPEPPRSPVDQTLRL